MLRKFLQNGCWNRLYNGSEGKLHTRKSSVYIESSDPANQNQSLRADFLTECHDYRRNHRTATCLSLTPRDEILLHNGGIFLCLQTVECLWQDLNDSTSAVCWQASLAVDETNNSKSTVKSSLTSQTQILHLNIWLGSPWGILWTIIGESGMVIGKESLLREHFCTMSFSQQILESKTGWMLLSLCVLLTVLRALDLPRLFRSLVFHIEYLNWGWELGKWLWIESG